MQAAPSRANCAMKISQLGKANRGGRPDFADVIAVNFGWRSTIWKTQSTGRIFST